MKKHSIQTSVLAIMAMLLTGTPSVYAFTAIAPASRTSFRKGVTLAPANKASLSFSRHAPLQATIETNDTDEKKQNQKKKKLSTDPTPIVWSFLQEHMGNTKTVVAASMFALMLALSPLSAEAAMSGGRMGGSFSAPRSSRALPSRSSYRGGYSGGYYGGGGYSRPNIIVAPTISPFYSPFYGPFGYGGGVVAYPVRSGGGFFNVVLLAMGAFALLNFLPSLLASSASGLTSSFGDTATSSALGMGTSVVQISVALQVPARNEPNSILSVLERLSQTAATDSRAGIQNLTSQVAIELLRRKSSITAAGTKYKHFQTREQAQREFNQQSIAERSKFEQETVSKYGGVDYSSRKQQSSRAGAMSAGATMAVVTLVLAIDGDSCKSVGQAHSIGSVEDALRKIAADAKVDDCLQSVEILWTPEDGSETLSPRDIVADYPELRTL